MKIFCDTGKIQQTANFGWQNKSQALMGLREGYKNSADELVESVINNSGNKKRDTYIFPILFSYRHAIELTLKHIYLRAKGKIPGGAHNLMKLWDAVKKEVLDEMVKLSEKSCFQKTVRDVEPEKIRAMIKELQESNQYVGEINNSEKQIDEKAEVWRYLMRVDNQLFFSSNHAIDYLKLKDGLGDLYERLDYIYHMLDKYLSSDC